MTKITDNIAPDGSAFMFHHHQQTTAYALAAPASSDRASHQT